MKRYVILGSVLAFATAGVIACTDDVGTSIQPPYDAGPKPAPTGEPEPTVDAGSDATTATGSDGGDGGDAATVTDSGDASTAQSYVLFVGSTYPTSELSVVALNPPSIAGRLAFANFDNAPYASGGRGFVLQRDLGNVITLDATHPWTASKTIDIKEAPDAADGTANPHAVVVTTGSKAYVARYSSNSVKIVDTATGLATGTLDLLPYLTVGDPDGKVDVDDAVFDATAKRIYFLLQRFDQFEYGPANDHVGKCSSALAAIVAFDTQTDLPVDLNGAATGVALELKGANPQSLTADFANHKLVVAATGCYDFVNEDAGVDAGATAHVGPRERRGVEAIDLAAGTTSWLYTSADTTRLDKLIWVDATHAFVTLDDTWYSWNPTQTTLGAAAPGFPAAPSYDGAGRVVGLASTTTDAGVAWSVVAYSVATGNVSTLIATDPFQSVRPTSKYGVAAAILR